MLSQITSVTKFSHNDFRKKNKSKKKQMLLKVKNILKSKKTKQFTRQEK